MPNNPDQWAALALFVLVVIMLLPSMIDKLARSIRSIRRRKTSNKNQNPDAFFDSITEFQNDIA